MKKLFKVELSKEAVAGLVKNQLGATGKDVIEHFVEVVGINNDDLLSLLINSTFPNFEKEITRVANVDTAFYMWNNYSKSEAFYCKVVDVNCMSLENTFVVHRHNTDAEGRALALYDTREYSVKSMASHLETSEEIEAWYTDKNFPASEVH